MRQLFFGIFGLVLLLTPVFAFAQEADFSIQSYSSNITILEDGRLDVREAVTVRFFEERHGIFRFIPYQYQLEDGREARTQIEVAAVRDGKGDPRPFQETREGNEVVIRIGDPDVLVSGTQTYVIEYTVEGALLYFDDHDELYWNVTGTDWPAEITQVSASVHFPEGVELTEANCYTGAFGEEGKDCRVIDRGRRVDVIATDILTIAVGFTPDVVAEVPATIVEQGGEETASAAQVESFLADRRRKSRQANLFWIVPFLAVFLFHLFLRRRYRNKKRRQPTIVAQFEAPDDLRPAEVAVLKNGRLHKRDLAATVVDFAVRGYVEIEEKISEKNKPRYVVNKKRAAGKDMHDWEVKLFEAMFRGRSSLSEGKLGEVFSMFFSLTEFRIMTHLIKSQYLYLSPRKARSFAFTFAFVAFVVFLLAGFLLMIEFHSAVPFFSFLLAGILLFAFLPRPVPKTEQGVDAFSHILGFMLFLKTAERYRLEWQEREHLFETYLPYAMVFKLVDKWTAVFDEIARETDTQISAPDWFRSSGGVFAPQLFSASMKRFDKQLAKQVSIPRGPSGSGRTYKFPGSSGGSSSGSGLSGSSSGGGGSSGGGFGGGGGGSW